MLILGFFFCQPNTAFAVKSVDISIYYERIEKVIDLSKTDINSVPVEDGYYIKYSKTDGYAYKMKRTKVSSEKELLSAMGVSDKSQMKYGQECILSAFQAATSDSMKDRAGASYLPSVELDLFDTSYDGSDSANGYKTGPTGDSALQKPNIRKDFWPCSTSDKKRISVSDVRFKYMGKQTPSGTDSAYSTVFHEYGHFMDKTKMESGAYGLDKTHYFNEITKPRAAFMEGWAEYNEMIEKESLAEMYKNVTKSLSVESETESGKYTTVNPKDATFQQLLSAECYNAVLLYRLSELLGKDKITEAFVATRWNTERDMRNLIRSLVARNLGKAKEICAIVDEVFLNKASNKEFLDMVGVVGTLGYVASRGKGDSGSTSGETASSTPSLISKIASATIRLTTDNGVATYTIIGSSTPDISSRFDSLIDKLKNMISKLAKNSKSLLEKLKEMIKKLFGNNEAVEVEDDVGGKAIKNDSNNEEDKIESTDDKITVEGSTSNPFAE